MRNRITATLLLVLAIVGLHFTAMTAVDLVPDPGVPLPSRVMAPEWLAIAVAAVTVLIIALGLIGSVVDQHLADRTAREAERLRRHVDELEHTRRELEHTTENLTRALEAAAASSQAKSQFLATMSHELRTPLNAVIGFSDLIAKEAFGPIDNARYREYAQNICNSGSHLLGLINDVLDLTKLDAGGFELDEREFDLAYAANDALHMIAGQADANGVQIESRFDPDVPPVRADERRVRQVILNLLANAVKFTERDGTVCIGIRRQDDQIVIDVTDTGIGIAEENIPRALERFGQIDDSLGRKYEGTGLGLPLSKRLMELHGGTLELRSTLGVGTTVTITFPADRVAADRRAA